MPHALRLAARSRRAASTLDRSLERPLAMVADSTFQFIGVLAPDGMLLDANRAALAFVHARLDEVVGAPFWDTPWWLASASREWLRGAVADAAGGVLVRAEVQHEAPDGRHIVVDFSLTPLRDESGEVYAVLAEGRDITDRKQLEQALRASEQRAAFLAEASEVLSSSLDFELTLERLAALVVPAVATFCIIDLVDERGVVRRVQVMHEREAMREPARRLASYPRRRQHTYLTSESLTHGRPRLVARVDDAFLAGLALDDEHHLVLRALSPASYMSAPLVARGRVLGAVAFCRDASAPPYAEADLVMAEDFAHRAALALDNARLYEQSLRSTQARDEMLGLVSHDLGNPLSAITMCVGTLLERERDLTPRVRELLGLVQDAAELSHRLIHDLLDASAIEAGRLSLERRSTDPLRVAVQAAELFESAAREQDVTLALDLPESLPRVDGDGDRLLQALANLVTNALKFTPAGGTVTIRGATDGGHVILSVVDMGPGVPPEDVPFIFDRYWHARRSAKVRGTGLGLAIVKGIVEAHGGRAWVEPAEGGGSRFSMAIPAARAGDEAP